MVFSASAALSAHADWQCPTCRLAARARENLLAIPNNPFVVAAVQALCAGGAGAQLAEAGWRRNKEGAPVFEFWSGSGGRIVASVDAPIEDAWRDVASYSALTLDCAVALLACLASDAFRAASAAPRCEAVRLGAPAILAMKKYKRFGAERAAFADVIDGEIAKLMRLRFDVVNYPAFDPDSRRWNGSGVSRSDVALFEHAPDAPPPDPYDCQRGQPLRLGAWAHHWLNAGGVMWVSSFAQGVLELDHRDNRGADALAKKIAVLLSLNWGAARKSREIRMDVRTLLRRVGELRRPGVAPMAHAGRLADRLEEALLRLSETGILPNCLFMDAASGLRAANRRWFDTWLTGEIAFSRPSFIEPKATQAPPIPLLAVA